MSIIERKSKTGPVYPRICATVISAATGLVLVTGIALAQTGSSTASTPVPASLATVPAENSPTKGADKAAETLVNHTDGVASIVNDAVISDYDLRQRMALFAATSGVPPTPELMTKIRTQVLEQLQTEQIQLQEARKRNISVSAAEVDKAVENITKANNISLDNLKEVFGKNGVQMSTLRSQIAVQLAWQKTVQGMYGDRIDVQPDQIDAELARLTEGKDKPRFLLAEIFLPIDNPEAEDKVKKQMEDLRVQLLSGASFPAVARQFSQSPTAAAGGDMGWVIEGQWSPEIGAAIANMRPGSVSEVIRGKGGFYLIAYRERMEPAGTKTADAPKKTHPEGVLPLARLLLPLPPNPPAKYKDEAVKAAMTIRTHIGGCGAPLQALVKQVRGAVYMNLGPMRLSDLSSEIQDAVAKTGPGETTLPFLSSAGVELIVRCDQAAPKVQVYTPPTREQVEAQLVDEQLSIMARRYLRDLRRGADVETR